MVKERVDAGIIYVGECLGCEHLHRMNAFSHTWYCDKEFKHNDYGKSWREDGHKMKKCKSFKQYEEKRCMDCTLAYSGSDFHYWHCGLDNHCFNYTDKACEHFSGSFTDYERKNKVAELTKRKTELVMQIESYRKAIKTLEQEVENLNEQAKNYI